MVKTPRPRNGNCHHVTCDSSLILDGKVQLSSEMFKGVFFAFFGVLFAIFSLYGLLHFELHLFSGELFMPNYHSSALGVSKIHFSLLLLVLNSSFLCVFSYSFFFLINSLSVCLDREFFLIWNVFWS